MRIIAGFGIDISNEYCAIDFETYCRINCFIKYQTTDPVDLIRIWIKILNPQSIMVISVQEMVDLFERISRGCIYEVPTLISTTFSKQMIELFQKEGCLIGEDRVDMITMQKKIEEGVFDVELFNQLFKFNCSYQVKSHNFLIE